jgi:hypothetical protein
VTTERDNAIDFIATSPEIALKMMERLERERDAARRLCEQLRDEVIVQTPDYELLGTLLKGDDFLLPWEDNNE